MSEEFLGDEKRIEKLISFSALNEQQNEDETCNLSQNVTVS
jgi:hypothetical protein